MHIHGCIIQQFSPYVNCRREKLLTLHNTYGTILPSVLKEQVCALLYHTTFLDTMGVIMNSEKNSAVEATLSLIGGKYKALILWCLSDGRRRFSELKKMVSGATPKMLTQQLRELEAQKLIHREVFPVVPPKVEYSLTETGKSLLPILNAMRDWGANYLRKNENNAPHPSSGTGEA